MNLNKLSLWFFCLAVFLMSCKKSVELPEEVAAFEDKIPETIDYNLHVKPILSDRCFKCHGPDKNKIEAGLQLATFEGATKMLENGHQAIVKGNSGESELVKRILTSDPDEVMPTLKSNLTLTNEEKAILIKWIDQGAKYKEHWSLTPIARQEVPSVGESIWSRWGLTQDAETRWVKNEIDYFALVKMKEQGYKPAVMADKYTLLRRVSMDLTGLPPTVAEVEAFVRDSSDNAYEKVVDRLLKSPHFGEQQAVSWLDLARYADSHGYQDDGMRNAYPYRDWVIKSFNTNLPFDKFITYQLAGDLLPNPTRDMLIATSFNRQHPQTQEGGVIAEEYRTEYVADRTNTFGKAMLGLTMECCRCHDHKYDPISTKDYYSLSAFFNQNKESGQIPYVGEASPTIMLSSFDDEKKLEKINRKIAILETENAPVHYRKNFESWLYQPEKATSITTLKKDLIAHFPFDEKKNKSYPNLVKSPLQSEVAGDTDRAPVLEKGKYGNGLLLKGDCGLSFYAEGIDKQKKKRMPPVQRYYKGLNFEKNQAFSIGLWVNLLKEGIIGSVFQRSNYEFESFRGYSVYLNPDRTLTVLFSYVWPANCIEIKTTDKLSLKQWQNLVLTYDGSGKASGVRLFLDGKPANLKIITDNLTKSILHGPQNSNFGGLAYFNIGIDERRKTVSDLIVDELKIYNRQLSALEVQSLVQNSDEVARLLAIPQSKLSQTQRNQLLEHYLLNEDSTYAEKSRKLSAFRLEELNRVIDIPEVMVMQELPKDQSRKTYILTRGVYDAFGKEVVAETPLRIGKLKPKSPRNRLGLAQWLLDDKNPLFARVMVNRIWLQYFGNGLVKTQEDFGNQGNLPSHPELLDWLALQFRQDGWDTKKFIRRMVTSATYQQSSIASAEEIEKDPDNKWLARGPSYRYSAEQVRDNALVASELLVRKTGGPSVYPYQPAGIWEALATRNVTSYKQQHQDSLYRRSMYTIWKRSSPPPMMLNFDAPDRQQCVVRRQKTATPLQSLVTMNDPQFIEAARVLAQRTMRETKGLDARIDRLFMSAISRPPRPQEKTLMKELYQLEVADFEKDRKRAKALLSVGEYPSDTTLNLSESAGLTVVASTILNYDEALVKR